MANEDPLVEVVNIIANLVRCVHLKRVLSAVDPEPPLNFWRVIHGNLLDMAVIDWCKLFGSDDKEHQKSHWKNMVADPNAFRTELFAKLGVDAKSWGAYWNEMKSYRDQYAAHRDFRASDITNFPTLDLALQSSCVYYDYVIAELRKKGSASYPVDLKAYGEAFAAQTKAIAEKAIAATASLNEQVF